MRYALSSYRPCCICGIIVLDRAGRRLYLPVMTVPGDSPSPSYLPVGLWPSLVLGLFLRCTEFGQGCPRPRQSQLSSTTARDGTPSVPAARTRDVRTGRAAPVSARRCRGRGASCRTTPAPPTARAPGALRGPPRPPPAGARAGAAPAARQSRVTG